MLEIKAKDVNLSLQGLVNKYVCDGYTVCAEIASNKGWKIIPVESAHHFDDADISNVCSALQNIGVMECWAALAENISSVPNYEVIIGEKELYNFSKKCSHFCFLLIDSKERFLILCTVYDYFIVAGNEEFVETCIGCSLDEGKKRFVEFIDGLPGDQKSILIKKFSDVVLPGTVGWADKGSPAS